MAPFLFLCSLYSVAGHAESFDSQSHEMIIAAVEEHLHKSASHNDGTAKIDITPFDHRLRVNHCDEALETFSPPGAKSTGKTIVGVRCSNPNPWTLYVSANIIIENLVVIATRDLDRGTVISANDVALAKRETNRLLRGHFNSIDEVTNRTLKRSVRRHQVITPSKLIAMKTIKRGEQITILAGNGNVQVRMIGKALRHGNPGDLIPVQNMTSKRKLEARVVSAGIVRID